MAASQAHSKTTALFSMIPGRLGIPEPFTGVDTLEKLDPQLQPEELEVRVLETVFRKNLGAALSAGETWKEALKCSFKTAS